MKSFFKASVLLGIFIFLLACKLVFQSTPSPLPSPSATTVATSAPTIAPVPTMVLPGSVPTISFLNPTLMPALPDTDLTPTAAYPTLIPTSNPTLLPGLLREALSIQTVEAVNGHKIRKITGWEYGFRQHPCCGHQWLDSNHLLLYPRTGEGMLPYRDGSIRGDLSSQPVIINVETGLFWLPQSYVPTSIYVSEELGIIFLQNAYGTVTGPNKEAIFTYTFDGKEIARYWGKILGVSPKGTKVLVDDDTIMDLRSDKILDLAWHMDYDLESSPNLYWSADETRVYRCCFYYADLKAGKSYNFEWSDLRGVDGQPPSPMRSPHPGGQWVRNDTYFFPKWDYWTFAGDPSVIFSPAEKKYYAIEIPDASTINPETMTYTISPNGMQVWITGYGFDGMYHSFLVNLTTFAIVSYDVQVSEFEWSPDSQFAILHDYSDVNGDSSTYLLSVSDKKLAQLDWTFDALWHPTDHIQIDLVEKGQALAIFNAKDRSIREWSLPTTFRELVWSPKGERIALGAKDGSLWQVDYPNLEHLEQLTPSLPDVRDLNWSTDGNSIAFISGSDIYVVETNK